MPGAVAQGMPLRHRQPRVYEPTRVTSDQAAGGQEDAMPFFGLYLPNFKYPGVGDAQIFERAAEIAVAAERAGFDALFPMDHLLQIPIHGPPTDPMPEGYTLLG